MDWYNNDIKECSKVGRYMYEKLWFCAKYLRSPVYKYVFLVNIVKVEIWFASLRKKSGERRTLEISFFTIFSAKIEIISVLPILYHCHLMPWNLVKQYKESSCVSVFFFISTMSTFSKLIVFIEDIVCPHNANEIQRWIVFIVPVIIFMGLVQKVGSRH